MSGMPTIAALLSLLTLAVPAAAGTGITNLTTLQTYATVQAAIDDASAGDIVELQPGKYVENIDFVGKAVTLRSASGDPSDTILDGGGVARVVNCSTGEGSGTVLQGLTIRNGHEMGFGGIGGGILVNDASPTIRGCVISFNTAQTGAGIACLNDSDPSIVDTVFFRNTVTDVGQGGTAGLYVTNSGTLGTQAQPVVVNCRFIGNNGGDGIGGLHASSYTTVSVLNCQFSGNEGTQGAAVHCGPLTVMNIWNSTIGPQKATTGTNGAVVNRSQGLTIMNSVLWGNGSMAELFNHQNYFSDIQSSIIRGGVPAGTTDLGGNLGVDPLYVDGSGPDNILGTLDDDFRLGRGSPGVGAADTYLVTSDFGDLDGDGDTFEVLPQDLDGASRLQGCTLDMGAYEQAAIGSCFMDLGGGTSGVNGPLVLTGAGALLPGVPASLNLDDAPAFAPLLAWVSFAPVPFAALGGTVHAFPFANQLLFAANAAGGFRVTTAWPPGVPPGTQTWFQFIAQDLTTADGLTLSNGLLATTP